MSPKVKDELLLEAARRLALADVLTVRRLREFAGGGGQARLLRVKAAAEKLLEKDREEPVMVDHENALWAVHVEAKVKEGILGQLRGYALTKLRALDRTRDAVHIAKAYPVNLASLTRLTNAKRAEEGKLITENERLLSLCRKLERERDELLTALDELKAQERAPTRHVRTPARGDAAELSRPTPTEGPKSERSLRRPVETEVGEEAHEVVNRISGLRQTASTGEDPPDHGSRPTPTPAQPSNSGTEQGDFFL